MRGLAPAGYRADMSESLDDAGATERVVGVQAVYDAVARRYLDQLADELDGKPLDRALLAALLELAGSGTVADLGCGPGHVTRWLAARHPSTVGIDLSPGMVALARARAPELTFQQGSMLDLAMDDGAWSAMVALYSVIHLTDEERATACREMARTLRPGGWVLLAFHVDGDEVSVGQVHRVTRWFGTDVELEAHFLEPEVVIGEVQAAGFRVMSRTEREPSPDVEYPSRRCYLMAQRR